MSTTTKKIVLFTLCLGFISISCEKDMSVEETTPAPFSRSQQKVHTKSLESPSLNATKLVIPDNLPEMSQNLGDAIASNAIEPSECAPTEFSAVQDKYFDPLANDLVTIFADPAGIYNLYLDLAFFGSYFDTSEQYFGENGRYTRFIIKRQRELEKFWGMPNEIRVNGEHTATLNNRERLADIYELVGVGIDSREEAYAAADQILFINTLSPYLPESPFFAIDGFATQNNLIVIGDGLVKMIAETGIEPKIVWTGILSHEWAHQVQFNNYETWYPSGSLTRYTELEADFMAGYFMTHKRGATYNWKRVEGFFELYFQIGDCAFLNAGHHGTPLQRLAATHLGYELANGAHKQGHILTAEELHEYFVAHFENLIV